MRFRDLIGRVPVDRFLLMLLGAVMLAALLPVRGEAARVFGGLTYAAVALLFFLYGARISPKAIWQGLLHWRLQGLVFLSTFALFPLIGLAVFGAAGFLLPADLALGLLFLTLLPSTVQSSIAFTSIAGGNVPAALTSASVSNLLGVVATPLLVLLVARGTGSGLSLDSIESIALQILAPFAVGQLMRPLIGNWLSARKRLTGLVDRGSILLVVYGAFSEGMAAGVWSEIGLRDLALVALFDVAILALVLALTTIAARRFGFSRPDEIAIVFCGSKKSMATGIPMANILFAGGGVAMIVLPLMLFHQIQLFVCASLARRYAAAAPAEAPPPAEAERELERVQARD